MKKLYTILLLAAIGAVQANALTYSATVNGNPVAENDTVRVAMSYSDDLEMWGAHPKIAITADVDATAQVRATFSSACNSYSFCYGDVCTTPTPSGKEQYIGYKVDFDANVPVELQVKYDDANSMMSPTCPPTKEPCRIDVISKMEVLYSFVIVVESTESSGIDDATPAPEATFSFGAGNVLTYTVGSPTTFNLYTLSGVASLTTRLSGSGTLALDSLTPGIYVYTAGGYTGKILVK